MTPLVAIVRFSVANDLEPVLDDEPVKAVAERFRQQRAFQMSTLYDHGISRMISGAL